jgi:hypothetical protein
MSVVVIRLSFDPLLSALLELASAGPEPVLVATGYCGWEHWTAHFFQELLVLRVAAEGSPEEPVVQQHKILRRLLYKLGARICFRIDLSVTAATSSKVFTFIFSARAKVSWPQKLETLSSRTKRSSGCSRSTSHARTALKKYLECRGF